MWLYGQQTITVSGDPVVFFGQRHSGSGYVFSLSFDFKRQHDQRVIWFYGWESLMVSYHPAKFGGYRYCSTGDMFSIGWRVRF